MRKVLAVLGLLFVGFVSSAEMFYKQIEGLGNVRFEYSAVNKGRDVVYDEAGMLSCQAILAEFYSQKNDIAVSRISYIPKKEMESNVEKTVLDTVTEYAYTIVTVGKTKLCYYNVDDDTVGHFTITILGRK